MVLTLFTSCRLHHVVRGVVAPKLNPNLPTSLFICAIKSYAILTPYPHLCYHNCSAASLWPRSLKRSISLWRQERALPGGIGDDTLANAYVLLPSHRNIGVQSTRACGVSCAASTAQSHTNVTCHLLSAPPRTHTHTPITAALRPSPCLTPRPIPLLGVTWPSSACSPQVSCLCGTSALLPRRVPVRQ
jgi:hypothetical protein